MTVRAVQTYLALRSGSPVLVRTMGSKSSPSVPVCSHSPDAVPIDSSVHKVFFECGPPSLCWPTSFPATSKRSPWHSTIGWSSRWHPDDVACHPKPPLRYNVLSIGTASGLWLQTGTDGELLLQCRHATGYIFFMTSYTPMYSPTPWQRAILMSFKCFCRKFY